MIYIHNYIDNPERLHTIINKLEVNGWTYISAIGYGGGGEFEEFCGKFKWSEEKEAIIGLFSVYHDPDEWEKEVVEDEAANDLSMPISIEEVDKSIIQSMVNTIWDEYISYDEENEIRLVSNNYVDKLMEESGEKPQGYYWSDDWDPDVVDWVSNNFWGLFTRFDW